MTNTYQKIFTNSTTLLPASNVTMTVPTSTTYVIATVTICNTSTSTSSTLTLYQGGSAAANMIQPTLTLLPGEKAVFRGPKTMAAADTMVFLAGTATVLSVLVEGNVIT